MADPIFYAYRSNPRMADLLMAGGDAQAQHAMRMGELWAHTLGNIGNITAGAIQQHQERKAQSRNERALLEAMNSWDDNDPQGSAQRLVMVAGPKEGLRMAEGLASLRKNAANEDPKSHLATARGGIEFWEKLSPEGKAQAWPLFRASLSPTAEKLRLPVQLPEQYTPELDSVITNVGGALDSVLGREAKAPPALMERDPTKDLIDRTTGEVKVKGIPKPVEAPKGPAVGSFEDYVVRKYGPDPKPDQIAMARKEYAAADNQAKSATTLTPTAESNIINRLSGQWTKAATTAKELSRQLTVMDVGLSEAEKGNLNAGSQAVLMTFNKILDPDSVVKEGEFARSASGQSLLNRAQGAFEKLTKGGQGVPLAELKQYAELAKNIVAQSGGSLEGVRKRISATAKRYNIPEELVMDEMGQAEDLPRVTSEADYAALPVGTTYLTPDGRKKRKGAR